MNPTPLTIAPGDGIGPEIMSATLAILTEAGAQLAPENIEVGQTVFDRGIRTGIGPEAWESLRRTRLLLKGPVSTTTTGCKSVNVTIRKALGLYANIRPARSYAPFIHTRHPQMDLVVVRENEEDLYAGVEHRQTDEVMQCLKLISRPGSEKIVRCAFEYARRNGRKKITCLTIDGVMRLTDGLFHNLFSEIGAAYPEIETEHLAVDYGIAQLADCPERFDVIVAPNLYGDIASEVAAQVAGGLGLAGSSNYADNSAMFEAIHGSAADLVGKDAANPSGLILSAAEMLAYIGQSETAAQVHNAWLCTIEEGIHTPDIFTEGTSRQRAGTAAFTQAVIKRLGKVPQTLKPSHITATEPAWRPSISVAEQPAAKKDLVGVDIFLHSADRRPKEIAARLRRAETAALHLIMVTNRGVKVWPDGLPETFCTDHWRCRFMARTPDGTISNPDIIALLQSIDAAGLDFIKCENLCNFDGIPGYALGQGQ